jgi:isocitrate/isopropylmalate dehydrogenase
MLTHEQAAREQIAHAADTVILAVLRPSLADGAPTAETAAAHLREHVDTFAETQPIDGLEDVRAELAELAYIRELASAVLRAEVAVIDRIARRP